MTSKNSFSTRCRSESGKPHNGVENQSSKAKVSEPKVLVPRPDAVQLRPTELAKIPSLIARGGPAASIGMGSIKQRRLGLPVKCHPGDFVGGYVPFYFCRRSIMLFLIHRANHPELQYTGGQAPILHLELDLHEVIRWADAQGRRWAFSLSNAGAIYSEFRCLPEELDQIDWPSVANTDFRSSTVKEGKQAEFLVADSVPWQLVRRIGASSSATQSQAMRNLGGVVHRPSVEVCRSWYFQAWTCSHDPVQVGQHS